jgi:hypothetical protein
MLNFAQPHRHQCDGRAASPSNSTKTTNAGSIGAHQWAFARQVCTAALMPARGVVRSRSAAPFGVDYSDSGLSCCGAIARWLGLDLLRRPGPGADPGCSYLTLITSIRRLLDPESPWCSLPMAGSTSKGDPTRKGLISKGELGHGDVRACAPTRAPSRGRCHGLRRSLSRVVLVAPCNAPSAHYLPHLLPLHELDHDAFRPAHKGQS